MLLAVGAGFTAAAQAGSLSGQVIDVSGTRTLAGAIVEIKELGRRAQVGEDGRYRFTNIPAGHYSVTVTYSGAAATEHSVDIAGDQDQIADLSVAPVDGDDVTTVLVIGQRANLASSISRQRASDEVQTVLTRDAIGQFPDQNVAESVRRAPGINVLNDQGEGRFISVRGLDPGLNAASINGVRVPAPEADTRAVALDVIPAELVESIEIKKSLTPEMDADTLGGSIEIKTTSALDLKKPFTSITAEGSYNDLRDSWSPKFAVDFSRMLTERIGVAGGMSYYDRKFSTDNIEADDWDTSDDGVDYAGTVEYRDYDVERKRTSATLALDYQASAGTRLYLKGLYSRFADQEYRKRLTIEFDEAPSAGDADHASFTSDDGEIAVQRDLKDRYEVQKIMTYTAGGDSVIGNWIADYQVAWSKAEEKEDGSLDPTGFERKFEEPGELAIDFDYSDRDLPRYSVITGAALFNDPAEYEFDKIERTTLSLSTDEEVSGKFDIAREFAADSGVYEIKFGAKVRSRDKDYNLNLDIFDGYDGDFTLADVVGSPSYGLIDMGPVPDASALRRFFGDNFSSFERNDFDSAFESTVADAKVGEDIQAGYIQGRYDTGRLVVIGGVRVEHTSNDLSGHYVELVEEGAERDGVVLDEDTLFITPVSYDRNYTDWLPSVNLRYDAREDVVVRAAAYASLLRPSAGQIAPRFVVEENDEGEREAEFGNPDLDAMHAWNYDVGAEWYFANNAVIQLGYFHKDIEDYIVIVERDDLTFNGVTVDEASLPINGDDATVDGIEFNYQQSFSFLPAPFDGLLFSFNYTYTDASGEADGRQTPLPATAENVYNAVLGYEKGPISLRVATTFRDHYLDELGGDADEDRYVDDHQQVDITAKYRVIPSLQLIAELINITDEAYVAYRNGPSRQRLLQYEEYSFTAKVGLAATF
jgi:TonB-dependent receptor